VNYTPNASQGVEKLGIQIALFCIMHNPVQLLETILANSVQQNISDIHCEPHAQGYRIRVREAGVLRQSGILNNLDGQQLVARLKVLAGLTSAPRLQDGRFTAQGADFRVSVVPVYGGEKAVVRILRTVQANLSELGMPETIQAKVLPVLHKPGLILVAGATGSGKTTTIHALLQTLDREALHVVTLEDPIEYILTGVSQLAIGLNVCFQDALRSVLRQDPDVLFLGEIRDSETAAVAVRAALTGHTVLATIHARDTAEINLRLLDLGVSDRVLAAVLTVSLAQYLYVLPAGLRKAAYELRTKDMFFPFPKS